MRFSNTQKLAGEAAVRGLSDKAQKWYGTQDWMTVYAVTVEIADDDDYLPEYGADVTGNTVTLYYTECDGRVEAYETKYELVLTLEAYADEAEG